MVTHVIRCNKSSPLNTKQAHLRVNGTHVRQGYLYTPDLIACWIKDIQRAVWTTVLVCDPRKLAEEERNSYHATFMPTADGCMTANCCDLVR